jgi:hypothetical protein
MVVIGLRIANDVLENADVTSDNRYPIWGPKRPVALRTAGVERRGHGNACQLRYTSPSAAPLRVDGWFCHSPFTGTGKPLLTVWLNSPRFANLTGGEVDQQVMSSRKGANRLPIHDIVHRNYATVRSSEFQLFS